MPGLGAAPSIIAKISRSTRSIEARHGVDIRRRRDLEGRLHTDIADYVADVLRTFTAARRGSRGQPILIRETPGSTAGEAAVISLERDAATGVYDVITAGPFSRRYTDRMRLVWAGSRNVPARPTGEADSSRALPRAETSEATPRSGDENQTTPSVGEAAAPGKGPQAQGEAAAQPGAAPADADAALFGEAFADPEMQFPTGIEVAEDGSQQTVYRRLGDVVAELDDDDERAAAELAACSLALFGRATGG